MSAGCSRVACGLLIENGGRPFPVAKAHRFASTRNAMFKGVTGGDIERRDSIQHRSVLTDGMPVLSRPDGTDRRNVVRAVPVPSAAVPDRRQLARSPTFRSSAR